MADDRASGSISPMSSIGAHDDPISNVNLPDVSKSPAMATTTPADEDQRRSSRIQYGRVNSTIGIKQWPDRPQKLHQRPIAVFLWDLHDIALVLMPIALIIKAGLCVHASKIDADHHGSNFDQTSQLTINLVRFNMQLTTLFTIIFVLIIAATVRRFALWKAQNGAKLAHLEQYQNSISMTATIKAIVSLRAYSFTSVALLFVWSWYYIGSQASEREYTYQEAGGKSNVQLAYINHEATSPFADGPASQFSTIRRTDMNSRYHVYISRVQTGISQRAFDINGYPLVPFYDTTSVSRLDSTHELHFDKEGWLDTTEFSLQHIVSSIGTTIYTNFQDPNSANFTSNWFDGKIVGAFTYTTSNFMVNCSRTTLRNASSFPGELPTVTVSLNMTPIVGTVKQDTVRSFEVWDLFNTTHSLQAICNITMANVDIKTRCTAAGCKAVAVRPVQDVPYPSLRTPFDSDTFASDFFNSLLLAEGVPDSKDDLTTLEADNGWSLLKKQLVADQNSAASTTADLQNDAYSFSLSIALTNHINTFYDASLYMKYELDFEHQLMTGSNFALDRANSNYTFIQVHGAQVSEQYALKLGWIVVDMVSNFVLLLAAIFAFWLRRHTLAPDVFGYVSSLTRDNPHLQLPLGGSTLSGMDRARLMKHVKVKFGHVAVGDNIGRVVMTHANDGEGTQPIRRLDRQDTYV